jgi:hypothetical protein
VLWHGQKNKLNIIEKRRSAMTTKSYYDFEPIRGLVDEVVKVVWEDILKNP